MAHLNTSASKLYQAEGERCNVVDAAEICLGVLNAHFSPYEAVKLLYGCVLSSAEQESLVRSPITTTNCLF